MGCSISTFNENLRSPEISLFADMSSMNKPESPLLTTCESDFEFSQIIVTRKILGVGGFGIVQLVERNAPNGEVEYFAMKSSSKESVLKRPNGVNSILSELRCLLLLRDERYICNVQFACQDTRYLYLGLELIEGGDMRATMRTMEACRFPEHIVQIFACQIILALDVCHSKGILHRDVKPENILLGRNGYLKLTDFGIAKILPDIENCRSTSGTHGYMAPEIYAGSHKHGTSAEWFALGVCLHEFLTGRRPFEASRIQAFRFNDHHDDLFPDYLQSCAKFLSDSCIDFISKLLSVKAHRRLGAWHGIRAFNSHPWLSELDWTAIAEQQLPALLFPSLDHGPICPPIHDAVKLDAIRSHKFAEPPSPTKQMLFCEYGFRALSPHSEPRQYMSSSPRSLSVPKVFDDGTHYHLAEAPIARVSQSTNRAIRKKTPASSPLHRLHENKCDASGLGCIAKDSHYEAVGNGSSLNQSSSGVNHYVNSSDCWGWIRNHVQSSVKDESYSSFGVRTDFLGCSMRGSSEIRSPRDRDRDLPIRFSQTPSMTAQIIVDHARSSSSTKNGHETATKLSILHPSTPGSRNYTSCQNCDESDRNSDRPISRADDSTSSNIAPSVGFRSENISNSPSLLSQLMQHRKRSRNLEKVTMSSTKPFPISAAYPDNGVPYSITSHVLAGDDESARFQSVGSVNCFPTGTT